MPRNKRTNFSVINLVLDKETHAEFKKACKAQNKTMNAILTECVEANVTYYKDTKKED
jgi:hypothetical protein